MINLENVKCPWLQSETIFVNDRVVVKTADLPLSRLYVTEEGQRPETRLTKPVLCGIVFFFSEECTLTSRELSVYR